MTNSPNGTNSLAPADNRHLSREAFLLALLLLLVTFFAFTAFLTRVYHRKVEGLASMWFARGEASFQAHDAAAALADYRNALLYAPNDPRFRFHLAQALAATGHPEEARSYLLNLLSASPGSGEINLELARIAAREGAMAEALRYFHGAIYGEWQSEPIAVRWQVRRELCEFLLARGSMNQAEAEIIQLADNTPPEDLDRLKIAGDLLLRAQIWSRALAAYRSVLAANKNDEDGLVGAGTAAFQLGHYTQAIEYLDRLPAAKRDHPNVRNMLELSRKIVVADPYSPGLSAAEKEARAAKALSLAESRLEECARQRGEPLGSSSPQSDLQREYAALGAMRKDWSIRSLRAHPDRIEAVMAAVFKIEALAAKECGPPQGDDEVLWLLGRSRGAIS